MKIKSIVIALVASATLATSSFAAEATNPTDFATIITKELSKFNLDYSKVENTTLKIKFMINDKNEIIVLSTDCKELDKSIKAALNYDKIDREGLVPFKVYIVPVSFDK